MKTTRMKMTKRRMRKRLTSLIFLLIAAVPLAAAGKKKAVPEAYSIVAGTVFREPGFALAQAEVTLIPNPQADGLPVKVKKLSTVSDARGEFVFRVPAASMRYTVKVAAKGYHGEEKTVNVQGEDRADVTFQLHEESKQ
jgi:Carboxypeptidase regulatory-like domain